MSSRYDIYISNVDKIHNYFPIDTFSNFINDRLK